MQEFEICSLNALQLLMYLFHCYAGTVLGFRFPSCGLIGLQKVSFEEFLGMNIVRILLKIYFQIQKNSTVFFVVA